MKKFKIALDSGIAIRVDAESFIVEDDGALVLFNIDEEEEVVVVAHIKGWVWIVDSSLLVSILPVLHGVL